MAERKKKKKNIGAVIVTLVIVAIFLASGIYYYHHTIIHDGKVTDIRYTDWAYEIESVEKNGEQLIVRGWCFKETEDTGSSMPELRIILQDTIDGSRKIYGKADYGISRPDVEAYFDYDGLGTGYPAPRDYTYCGFEVPFKLEKVGSDHTYEILMQQNDRDPDVVKTGVYLRNGELYQSDPDRFVPPDTEGTDLTDIVENGILRAYAPETGLYIYQKEQKLYLLLDAYSTQGMEAYEHGYYEYYAMSVRNSMEEYDYLIDFWSGYYYSDEITYTCNTGHYHVIERSIPDIYPVAWIEIGIYTPEGLINFLRFFPKYGFRE